MKLPQLSAVNVITNNAIAARFWMIIAIALAITATVAPYFTIQAMKQQEKVVILDPSGSLIYSPLLGFEEAGQLNAYHVRLACLSFLQRNPRGLDLPELYQKIYIEPARSYGRKLINNTANEFSHKQIHQKVELTTIRILETKKISDSNGAVYEAIVVHANGNLIKTGIVNDLEFREPAKFQMELVLIRNPNLLQGGMLPLVVYQLNYKEKLL
jgi:hypothetical protein